MTSMNRIAPFLLACCATLAAAAQDIGIPHEGELPFVPKVKDFAFGFSTHYIGTEKEVEEVLARQFLDLTRAKAKSFKNGFMLYEQVIFSPVSATTMDYYVKIEAVSKDDKEHCILTLFPTMAGMAALSPSTHPAEVAAARLWLQSLDKKTRAARITTQIGEQTKLIGEAERSLQKLLRDQAVYENTIREFQAKLAKNGEEQKTQQAKIAAEKDLLGVLQGELTKVQQ